MGRRTNMLSWNKQIARRAATSVCPARVPWAADRLPVETARSFFVRSAGFSPYPLGQTQYGLKPALKTGTQTRRLATALATFVFCCFVPALASAHPLSQGTLEVVIHPDRVDVRAHVTVEEASVTNMLTDTTPASSSPGSTPAPAAPANSYEQHARYLVAHLHVAADGKPLVGHVVGVTPPTEAGAAPSTQPAGSDRRPEPAGDLRLSIPSRGRARKPAPRRDVDPIDAQRPDRRRDDPRHEVGGDLRRPDRAGRPTRRRGAAAHQQ